MDEQPRLTDLIPIRLHLYLIPLAIGGAIIAGLELLYSWMPRLASMTTDGRVAAFDLDGEGSLAVWFSSMTLAAAGLVAILVYTVRQHKVDDYHGRYRIWLWAALCWFLMSLDETASLHEGFKELMVLVSGTRLFGDGSIWWVVPYFFLLAAVGTRLLVDMRHCWLSSSVLIGTAICYALSVVAQLGWILPEAGAQGVMLEEGAELVGDLLLFMAMALHARYVIMDAQGLIAPPAQKVRAVARAKDESDSEDDDESESSPAAGLEVKVHPPHGTPRPTIAPTPVTQLRSATIASAASSPPPAAPNPTPSPNFASSSPTGAVAPAQHKLTKEERKALKKKMEKMRREREQRGR
jgi:hypothetical protein